MSRAPIAFVPHGGGPWPILSLPVLPQAETVALATYMRSIGRFGAPATALVVVSAHWEEDTVTVNTGPAPGMYFDYYNFPDHAYTFSWPAPGAPDVAERALALLSDFQPERNNTRGYDHGTFIPLMLAYPDANIPVVQISLKKNLDPAEHIAIGKALAPLREDGVVILGSGNSYHNLRQLFHATPRGHQEADAFDAWLADTIRRPQAERDARLAAWHTAPAARACHPREEHLIPLMVVAGAAGADPGRIAWSGTTNGYRGSAIHFD